MVKDVIDFAEAIKAGGDARDKAYDDLKRAISNDASALASKTCTALTKLTPEDFRKLQDKDLPAQAKTYIGVMINLLNAPGRIAHQIDDAIKQALIDVVVQLISGPEGFHHLGQMLGGLSLDYLCCEGVIKAGGTACSILGKQAQAAGDLVASSKLGATASEMTDALHNAIKTAFEDLKGEKAVVATSEGAITLPAAEMREIGQGTQAVKNGAKAGATTNAVSREIILPKVKTFEQARNQALKIVGDLGPDSKPYFCRLKTSAGFRRIVGRMSSDCKVLWRLDWDQIKGIHINIENCRLGKGVLGKTFVIPFEGDEQTFVSLLKHLNR